jgi:lysophospholipid acyltransferase (LPLAT)-like uncharacterized protein
LPYLIFFVYRALLSTWRITFIEPQSMRDSLNERTPLLLAFWHGDEMALIHVAKRYRILTMTSISQDGELMDKFFKLLGGQSSRGSSSRKGASGLRELVRMVKRGQGTPALAVDGPKGPRHVVKPGVFELSKLVNAPIYCAGVAVSSAWHFPKTWNKTYLPKPFAKIIIQWQGPFPATTREQDVRSPELGLSLANTLDDARHSVAKLIAR